MKNYPNIHIVCFSYLFPVLIIRVDNSNGVCKFADPIVL